MECKPTIIEVFNHLDCINFFTFTDNFTTYQEMNILEKADFILLGDFNIHINSLDDPNASIFRDFLSSLVLKNHITFSTYHSVNKLILSLQMRHEQPLLLSDKEKLFQITTLSTSIFYIGSLVENLTQ